MKNVTIILILCCTLVATY